MESKNKIPIVKQKAKQQIKYETSKPSFLIPMKKDKLINSMNIHLRNNTSSPIQSLSTTPKTSHSNNSNKKQKMPYTTQSTSFPKDNKKEDVFSILHLKQKNPINETWNKPITSQLNNSNVNAAITANKTYNKIPTALNGNRWRDRKDWSQSSKSPKSPHKKYYFNRNNKKINQTDHNNSNNTNTTNTSTERLKQQRTPIRKAIYNQLSGSPISQYHKTNTSPFTKTRRAAKDTENTTSKSNSKTRTISKSPVRKEKISTPTKRIDVRNKNNNKNNNNSQHNNINTNRNSRYWNNNNTKSNSPKFLSKSPIMIKMKSKTNQNPPRFSASSSLSNIKAPIIIKNTNWSWSKNFTICNLSEAGDCFHSKVIKAIDSITKKGYSGPGVKKYNQDNYFIFNNFVNSKIMTFIGVCDGHGMFGHDVSKYWIQRWPKKLSYAWISEQANISNFIPTLSNPINSKIKSIITETFDTINTDITDNKDIDSTYSGSTCSTCIITGNKVISWNVGDSRSVIGRYNKTTNKWMHITTSRDHKPNEPDEMKRILSAGGRVEAYRDSQGEFIGPERVWWNDDDVPGLAMSRSFGDEVAQSVGVISTPEIKSFDLTEEDKFLIIASDGIWEFISSEECVNIVKDYYWTCDINSCVNYWYKEASKRWIWNEEVIDDITAVVVFFE